MNSALLERLKLTTVPVDSYIPVDIQSLLLGHLRWECPNLSLPEVMLARLWIVMALICIPEP